MSPPPSYKTPVSHKDKSGNKIENACHDLLRACSAPSSRQKPESLRAMQREINRQTSRSGIYALARGH